MQNYKAVFAELLFVLPAQRKKRKIKTKM